MMEILEQQVAVLDHYLVGIAKGVMTVDTVKLTCDENQLFSVQRIR
jgi:hypothetical protein